MTVEKRMPTNGSELTGLVADFVVEGAARASEHAVGIQVVGPRRSHGSQQ